MGFASVPRLAGQPRHTPVRGQWWRRPLATLMVGTTRRIGHRGISGVARLRGTRRPTVPGPKQSAVFPTDLGVRRRHRFGMVARTPCLLVTRQDIRQRPWWSAGSGGRLRWPASGGPRAERGTVRLCRRCRDVVMPRCWDVQTVIASDTCVLVKAAGRRPAQRLPSTRRRQRRLAKLQAPSVTFVSSGTPRP